jgi:S-DNA-T family DNA segregation ATPase FtsK/SpoIIIE
MTSSGPQPPKFRQGPRDFCLPPEATLKIPSPGMRPSKPELHLESLIIPVSMMVAGAVATMVLLSMSPVYAMLGVMMAVGGGIVTLIGYNRQRGEYHESVAFREQRFRDVLATRRAEAAELLEETRRCLLGNDPDLPRCLEIARNRDPRHLWARLVNDHDFLRVRLGLGTLPFQVKFELPSQMDPLVRDPLEREADELNEEFRDVTNVPILLDMGSVGLVGIIGERHGALATARVTALQLAMHHSPEVLRLAAIFPEAETAEWSWMRWLPHTWQPTRQQRYLAADESTAKQVLKELTGTLRQRDNQTQTRRDAAQPLPWPSVFVVYLAESSALDDEAQRLLFDRGPSLGFYTIILAEREAILPRQCQAVITPGEEASLRVRQAGAVASLSYRPDIASLDEAEELSRLMAPLRFESAAGAIPNLVSLFDLMGLSRVEEWDVIEKWKTSDSIKSLAVPIGIGAGGRQVMFDLHDDGHGPHGLAAGTSGSGKTRFLECLVAILAANYHPHELGFMLVDFKGSDFVQVLPELPHCISVLKSIEGKSKEEQGWHASRALKALQAESRRRQSLFAEKKISKISEYHQLRRADPSLKPVPRLVIVVDEFAELATQQPDFLDGLVSLARIGRSLGMHLLLATQQPAGIVTDQIWANSRFRISLKFNKTEDSQAVLKRPEAAYIEQKGRGYLQVGENEVFELFQGPFGGIPYEEVDVAQLEKDQQLEVIRVPLNGKREIHSKKDQGPPRQNQLKALVQYICRETERAGIEPVPNLLPDTPDDIIGLEDIHHDGGWNGNEWCGAKNWLRPAIGILDDPTRQIKGRSESLPLLYADLARFGHLFVCCDIADHTRLPLRTLVTSLAMAHSPRELNIYALDFGNNALSIFKGLPHIGEGGIIPANDRQRITRLFRWLFTELEERRELLTDLGLTWAEAKGRGEDLKRPAIVLVVDNLVKWKDETDRRDELGTLINEGAPNGIHVVLAGESRSATLFGNVLEGVNPRLALGFADHKAFREIIDAMPWDQPVLGGIANRGIYYDSESGAVECRVVAPAKGGDQELRALISQMKTAAERAKMPEPFAIEELKRELPLAAIMPNDVLGEWRRSNQLRMPIGQDDLTLAPLVVDLAEDGPHFLIVGPPRGGKTIALQAWLLSLAARVSPEAMRLVLFDNLRHTLEPLRDLPHVWRYVSTDEDVTTLLKELRERLGDLNAPTLTPPVVMVIDDLSQLKSDSIRSNLADLARQGASRGLYVLASGRTADLKKYEELEKALLRYRSGLFVGSHIIETDASFFDVNLPLGLARERLPRGRGYLVRQGEHRMVQVATPGDADRVREWVQRIVLAREVWTARSAETAGGIGGIAAAPEVEMGTTS